MKQFQFSLNTVLGVRSNEEQLAAEGHATAQEALEAILMQRQLVEEAIHSNLAACQQAFDGQVKSGTIAHLQAALKELRAQLEAFIPELRRLQAEADAKRREQSPTPRSAIPPKELIDAARLREYNNNSCGPRARRARAQK